MLWAWKIPLIIFYVAWALSHPPLKKFLIPSPVGLTAMSHPVQWVPRALDSDAHIQINMPFSTPGEKITFMISGLVGGKQKRQNQEWFCLSPRQSIYWTGIGTGKIWEKRRVLPHLRVLIQGCSFHSVIDNLARFGGCSKAIKSNYLLDKSDLDRKNENQSGSTKVQLTKKGIFVQSFGRKRREGWSTSQTFKSSAIQFRITE